MAEQVDRGEFRVAPLALIADIDLLDLHSVLNISLHLTSSPFKIMSVVLLQAYACVSRFYVPYRIDYDATGTMREVFYLLPSNSLDHGPYAL
jgi:hypothetical protein